MSNPVLKYTAGLFCLMLMLVGTVSAQIDAPDAASHKLLAQIEDKRERVAALSADSLEMVLLIHEVSKRIIEQSKVEDQQHIARLTALSRYLGRMLQEQDHSARSILRIQLSLEAYKRFLNLEQTDQTNAEQYGERIHSIELYLPEKDVETLLLKALESQPALALKYAFLYYREPFFGSIIEKSLLTAPVSVKKYLASSNMINAQVRSSQSERARTFVTVFNEYGMSSKAFLFIDLLLDHQGTIDEIHQQAKDEDWRFVELSKRMLDSEAYFSFSARRELEYLTKSKVREWNSTILGGESALIDAEFTSLPKEAIFTSLLFAHQESSIPLVQKAMGWLAAAELVEDSQLLNRFPDGQLAGLTVLCEDLQLSEAFVSIFSDQSKLFLFGGTATTQSKPSSSNDSDQEPVISDQLESVRFDPARTSAVTADEITDALPTETAQEDAHSSEKLALDIPDVKSDVVEPEQASHAIIRPEPIELQTIAALDAELNAEVPKLEATIEKVAQVKPIEADEVIKLEVKSVNQIGTASARPSLNLEKVFPEVVIAKHEREIIKLKSNVQRSVQAYADWFKKPYAHQFMLDLCRDEPEVILSNSASIVAFPEARTYIECAAINAPMSAKKYLYNQYHPVSICLKESEDSAVKLLLTIYDELKYMSRSFALLPGILSGRYDLHQAHDIGHDQNRYFKALVQLALENPKALTHSIKRELNHVALDLIRDLNTEIAAGRLGHSVQTYSKDELYALMIYGQEEVLSDSYRLLIKTFKRKLNGSSLTPYLSSIEHHRFRTFIRLSADFGQFEELAIEDGTLNVDLIKRFVSNIELSSDPLSQAVEIADAMGGMELSTQQEIAELLALELKRVTQPPKADAVALYSLLLSLQGACSTNQETVNWKELNKVLFSGALETLKQTDIAFSGRFSQQHFFYNDLDGQHSFQHFIGTYRQDQHNWKVVDKGSFVLVQSTQSDAFVIAANKPEYESNGMNAIENYFLEKRLVPLVMVHRGHGHHTDKTIKKLHDGVKFVFLGSCGGFHKIRKALDQAPASQILATKSTGTKHLNDPILKEINDDLAAGNDIYWPEFWAEISAQHHRNPLFKDYVPPHKNVGAQMVRAYYQILLGDDYAAVFDQNSSKDSSSGNGRAQIIDQ